MTWEIGYTVEGFGFFPTDMLRYDSSFPSSSPSGEILGREQRQVKLIHRGVLKTWKPTTARWNSFSWEVVDVNLPVKLVA